MNVKQLRIELSAVRARGYFETEGRGLLFARRAHGHPLVQWFQEIDERLSETTFYENRYITLEYLQTHNAPAELIHQVETYDADSHAVIAIEWDEGDPIEPQIVPLPSHDAEDSHTPVNAHGLPF